MPKLSPPCCATPTSAATPRTRSRSCNFSVEEAVRSAYGETQQPELTVLKGIGPFAVALSRGATSLGAFDQSAPPDKQAEAVQQVQVLKAEAARGEQADDSAMARIIDGLADLVPQAVKAVVSTFASPLLDGIAGPATRWVLEKLKGVWGRFRLTCMAGPPADLPSLGWTPASRPG